MPPRPPKRPPAANTPAKPTKPTAPTAPTAPESIPLGGKQPGKIRPLANHDCVCREYQIEETTKNRANWFGTCADCGRWTPNTFKGDQ